MHDTEIYVPSRDDNCRLADRQLFVLVLFRLIGPGIIGRLIERSDLRLFGILESNRSPMVVKAFESPTVPILQWKQNWGSLSGDCQRGKLPPHYGEGNSVKSYSED